MPDPRDAALLDWGLALRLGRRLAGDPESRLDEATVASTSAPARVSTR